MHRILVILVLSFTVLSTCALAADAPASKATWKDIPTSFRPMNISASGNAIWVCGTNEMITVSLDAGSTWAIKHKNPNGEILLNIAFVDAKIGFAGGTGGLLLSTGDGGETWKPQRFADTVRGFSFADISNGVVVTSARYKDTRGATINEVNGNAFLDGAVRVTHDGGEHWQEITALKTDEAFEAYSEVHSVAALDPSHLLVSLHEPQGEYIYAVTQDGGKTWKPVHLDDIYAATVFVYDNQFWAFGVEMLDPKGRRYGAPVTLHSKDGLAWVHGVRGPKEFPHCTAQGCNMWDGMIEDLYSDHEKFWALPQDGSLTSKWAIVGNTACTVGASLKCGSALETKEPQPRPEQSGPHSVSLGNVGFTDDCLACSVSPIRPVHAVNGQSKLDLDISVARDGSADKIAITGSPNNEVSNSVVEQVRNWLFEPAHRDGATIVSEKHVQMLVMCAGFPERGFPVTCNFTTVDFLKPK